MAKDLAQEDAREGKLVDLAAGLLKDIKVTLKARLGEVSVSVSDLMSMQAGTVLRLDSHLGDLVELHLNDGVVARGEIVAVDDHFGVRIKEVGKVQ